MPIEAFYLIVTDRDKKVFNIVGPMTDDTSWNKKVCECQDQGRHINCQTVSRALSREELISRIAMQLDLKYTDDPIL
ncbi:hypothetical protein [Methylobacter sp. BlB1]|uniref:hypothetical protein n=1 Tax=Methylobacter sp. BlB1 TaxID=2785914 RepID=UPI0018939DAA|nr:hypothetical protein [Methylobacter sp. BlB1]MBF6650211.1 hypothetical protein [Methylobacter sp. BlB1]